KSYCLFHQIEGFYVDSAVSFAELKGVLAFVIREFFGKETQFRIRPSYFPFTEPSLECDIMVKGKSGWMEILGAGMIHPQVLKSVGYDPQQVQGYAFGMGIERITMLRYGIDDIRLLYDNDLRFLAQF
ncbi:phenylalanine--tRNA ligase subunit alpha, partial [bacterium]|nr:phenylalanine--tRNA ligase subunit alpha [bacterium]